MKSLLFAFISAWTTVLAFEPGIIETGRLTTLADDLVEWDVVVVGKLSESSMSDYHGYTNIDIRVDSVVIGMVSGATLRVVTAQGPTINGKTVKRGARILAWAKWSSDNNRLFGYLAIIRSNGSLEFDEDAAFVPEELDDDVPWSAPGRLQALLNTVDSLRFEHPLSAFNGAQSAVLIKIEGNPSPGILKIQTLADVAGRPGCRPILLQYACVPCSTYAPAQGDMFLVPLQSCAHDTVVTRFRFESLRVLNDRVAAFSGATVEQAKKALRYDGSRLRALSRVNQ